VIREVALAVMLVGLLAIAGEASASTTSTGWSATLAESSVVQGAQILAEVSGPPNGTYAAIVNVQPFNSSAPALAVAMRLPAFADLANGSAVGEVSLNTTSLGAEMVQVTLSNATVGTFARFWVQVWPGGPELAGEDQKINQLGLNLAENASRVNSLLSLRQDVQNWALFAVIWSSVWSGVLLYVVLATRTSAQERRFMRAGVDAASAIATRRLTIDSDHGVDNPIPLLESDGRAVFVLDPPVCETCRIPQRRARLAEHARTHKLTEEEIESRTVPSVLAERESRTVIEASRLSRPAAGRKPRAPEAQTLDMGDLSDLAAMDPSEEG
jgi:hypothetical protein